MISSSSGGAFTALSDYFLQMGNAVVSTVYNYESHTAEFEIILDNEQRDKAKGSKYMQSKPKDAFKKAEQWLKDNPQKMLLFVGMGCQAEGFRKFSEIKGFRDRVYIVDIICHGSPSPKLWKEYACSLEQKSGCRISYLTFKDKRNGWNRPTAVAVINKNEIPLNDYVRVFYNRCALRPSCHKCPFATIERKTDLTIGDFWHIEMTIPDFYDPDGTSVFLIHTNYGEKLFDNIKKDLNYRQSDPKQCWQANLESPTPVSEHRQKFWNDYKRKGIGKIIKKYGADPLKSKIRNKILRIPRGN